MTAISGSGSRDALRERAHTVLIVLGRTTAVLAVLTGASTLLASVFGVVNRLWLDGEVTGVDEFARYSLGWFAAFSAAYATAMGAHFRLTFLIRRVAGRRYTMTAETITIVGGLIVGGLLLVAGIRWLPQAATRTSLSLHVSLLWAHLAIPVLGGCIVLFSLLRAIVGPERLAADRVRLPIQETEFEEPPPTIAVDPEPQPEPPIAERNLA